VKDVTLSANYAKVTSSGMPNFSQQKLQRKMIMMDTYFFGMSLSVLLIPIAIILIAVFVVRFTKRRNKK